MDMLYENNMIVSKYQRIIIFLQRILSIFYTTSLIFSYNVPQKTVGEDTAKVQIKIISLVIFHHIYLTTQKGEEVLINTYAGI